MKKECLLRRDNIAVYGNGMVTRYLQNIIWNEKPEEAADLSGVSQLYVIPKGDPEEAAQFCISLLESRTDSTDSPVGVVFLSSWLVYSPEGGENVSESAPTFAWSPEGRSYARAEMLWEKWTKNQPNSSLAVVRPGLIFGKGVDGELLKLFNRVVRGHYVHIRGNDARTSTVTALDVARVMVKLIGRDGICNAADGRGPKWVELCEAMTANVGARKRMTYLPRKWAEVFYRYGRWLPIVQETLSPEALRPMARTLVLDNTKVKEATGIEFYDTLAVISRTDKNYPYED